MTLASIAAAVRPWLSTALAAVMAMAAVQQCGARQAVERQLRAEAARDKAEFQDEKDRLVAENRGLAAALEEEKKKGAKPVEVFSGATGPLTIPSRALLPRPRPTAPQPAVAQPGPVPSCPAPSSAAAPDEPLCALAATEHPEITAAGAIVQGKAGERRVHLEATAWGSDPRRVLFGGVITAPVESEEPLVAVPELRPRFAVRAEALWDGFPTGAPSGVQGGAELRVWDRWWITASLRSERNANGVGVGVRREFP